MEALVGKEVRTTQYLCFQADGGRSWYEIPKGTVGTIVSINATTVQIEFPKMGLFGLFPGEFERESQ